MKKTVSILLSAILCVTLASCASSGTSSEAGSKTTSSPTASVSSPSSEPEAAPSSKPEESSEPESSEAPAPSSEEPPEEPVNKPTITLEEFKAIENGMSYEEVCEIIGGEGELLSEGGEPGSAYYTVMYQWKGEGSLGANANAMFQGGKLTNKAQFGLK